MAMNNNYLTRPRLPLTEVSATDAPEASDGSEALEAAAKSIDNEITAAVVREHGDAIAIRDYVRSLAFTTVMLAKQFVGQDLTAIAPGDCATGYLLADLVLKMLDRPIAPLDPAFASDKRVSDRANADVERALRAPQPPAVDALDVKPKSGDGVTA
jgi:hypothetical protein